MTEHSPIRRTYLGAGGLKLCADVFGHPKAPPVILLHGGGQTKHAWKHTGATLAVQGFHVIAYDMRGHGDSEYAAATDNGGYATEAFIADLESIIASLGTPPILVGASFGGQTALLIAGERPDIEVAALILVDSVARNVEAGVDRVIQFMETHVEGFDSLDQAGEYIAAYNPGRAQSTNHVGLTKNLRQTANGRWKWHWDPRFLEIAKRNGIDYPRREASARRVSSPTLIIRGRQSDVVSHESVQNMQKLIPHAEIKDVADAGHMVAGDANDIFTEVLFNFASRVIQDQDTVN